MNGFLAEFPVIPEFPPIFGGLPAVGSFQCADFDGDGDLDVVFVCARGDGLEELGAVVIALNTTTDIGSPQFVVDQRFDVAPRPESVAVGDLDGDGLPDLAVGPGGTDWISLFFNNPADPGHFFRERIVRDNTVLVSSLQVVDVDRDGLADLTGSGGNNGMAIYYQDPAQPSGFHVERVDTGEWTGPVFARDMDGDGSIDLAASMHGAVLIAYQDPAQPRSFSLVDSYPTSGNSGPIAAADLDDDGVLDLATSVPGGLELMFQDPQQSRLFSTPVFTDVGANPADQPGFEVEDFDGDGKTDLCALIHSSALSLRLQDLQVPGTFLPTTITAAQGPVYSLAVGDFDGDGLVDVLAAGVSPDIHGFQVLLQDRANPGTLLPPILVPVTP